MLIKILYWLLKRQDKFLYENIDEKRMRDWLFRQNDEDGFRDYFRLRDLSLLKHLGQGLEQRDYWIYVGHRRELLHLLSEVNREGERFNKHGKKDKEK